MRHSVKASLIAAALALAANASALAQSGRGAEKFYHGKTISLYIGDEPGSSYDLYGRFIAQFLPRYIPGSPEVVVRNMPGAGGVVMTNWLYNAAPRDGTAVAIAFQGTAIEERLGSKGPDYKADKFSWIGRISPITEVSYTWASSPTKTLEDARRRETIMGGTALTSPSIWYLKVLNALAGTKFKGIPGIVGNSSALIAMQRGELEGFTTSWATLKSANSGLLRDNKLNILIQYGPEPDADLPRIPLMSDFGRSAQDKQALRLFTSADALGRSLVGAPAIPPERLAALRDAYERAMKDPAAVAQAKKMNLPIGPALGGEALAHLMSETLATPDSVAAIAKAARGQGN